MGVERSWQAVAQHRRDVGPAVPGDTIGENELQGRLDFGGAVDFEVQPKMSVTRLDAAEPGAIANGDADETPVPAEVVCPGGARDAFHCGINSGAVPRLVPGLK